jgi:uncharacterized RDD family membrane protein YckC
MFLEKKFEVTNDVLASHGQRLANVVIDRILFTLFFIIIVFILAFIGGLTDNNFIYNLLENLENVDRLTDVLLTGLLFAVFYSIFEFTTQRSIGKYISKTKVVTKNGEKPSLQDIIVRSLVRIIFIEVFSFLGSYCRGWHDMASKTYVVDVKKFEAKKNNFYDFEQLGKSENEVVF